MLNRSLVDGSLMVREAHHERLNFKFFRLKLVPPICNHAGKKNAPIRRIFWKYSWRKVVLKIDRKIGREQKLIHLVIAEGSVRIVRTCYRSICPVITDVRTKVQPLRGFVIHAHGECVIISRLAGRQKVSSVTYRAAKFSIIGCRSYTAWRTNAETVVISKPFATNANRQIISNIIVNMGVDTIPLGILGCAV